MALLVASLAIAWLLAEVLVLLFFGPQVRFPRHVVEAPWGLRYNDPLSDYRHRSADGTWHFAINGQGMRDAADHAYEKPPGVRRILSLGDSFTIGYEVAAEETFSAVLERELRAAGVNAEVLNAGVSGFSTAEECLYVERELIKYQPDVVLVSFFGNDLVDNTRTGLFRFEGDRLVPWNEAYVPAGRAANYLNRSTVFNWLSERSNFFAFAKERLTLLVKRDMVAENEQNLAAGETSEETQYQRRLAAAIFERLYRFLRERNIPLVIHSIPTQFGPPDQPLQELFPLAEFNVGRPRLLFVPAKAILDPLVGRELLYRQRSHFHWTPMAHEKAGAAIARKVLDGKILLME